MPSEATDSKETSGIVLKAIYLVHIGQLTTWPEGLHDSPNFSICINKTSSLSPKLKQIKKHITIKGKPLKIQHDLSLKQLLNCNVFFVSSLSDNMLFKQYQSKLEANAVLTVSDEADFSDFTKDGGGVISYYIDDEKVKMHVNLKTMRKIKLNIRSKLLRLMVPRS